MTWTAKGSIFQAEGSAPATDTVSLDNQAVGDLLVLIVITFSATGYASGVSGGGATWVQAGTVFTGTVNSSESVTVWLGTVTATGSQTATLAYTGSPVFMIADGYEFATSLGSWALDGSPGYLDSSDTADMPSLTPAGAGELYVSFCGATSTPADGSTSGYTYIVDASGDPFCYNTDCTSAAQSANWGSATLNFGAAVLVEETAGGPGPVYAAFMSSM